LRARVARSDSSPVRRACEVKSIKSIANIAVQQIVAVEKKLSRMPHHVQVAAGSPLAAK
jgi:hypothetical protein